MAVTQNTYTGNGSTTNYSFTFPYLETTDIKVTLNGVATTAYTLANATTVSFNTAPANGVAIRIYRETASSNTQATFYPGSAIRSQDLNNNFTQSLYLTQESDNNAVTAISSANTAISTANAATSTANTALSNSTAAVSSANAAVSTANTASSNATAAVNTANTAASNASTALSTANSASTAASTAVSTANTATSTANTALSNSTTAISTANSASTNASNAVTTANTASSNANSAVSTANAASTTATTALNTANTASSNASSAVTTANAAAAAVANAVLYTTVANVAAIPSTPSNNTAVEVTNSTGIESFTPLSGLPSGFVGSSGLSVRIIYQTSGSTWTWIQYFPNDPETRYLKLQGGTVTGNLEIGTTGSLTFEGSTANAFETTVAVVDPTADRTITLPNVTGTVVTTGDTGTVTSTMILDGTIVDGDVNASAAIAGTKISPDFGSQTITTTGVVSAALGAAATPSITFTGDLNTGIYSPGADQVAISTNGSQRLLVDSSGNIGVGGAVGFGRITHGIHVTGAGTGEGIRLQTSNGSTGILEIAAESGGAVLDTRGSGYIRFNSSTTEWARFDSNGRLGLGTSTPQLSIGAVGGNVLHVAGAGTTGLRIQNTGGNSVDIYAGTDGFINQSGSGTLNFQLAGSTKATLTSTGLGIGTTAPTVQFEVSGTDARIQSTNSVGGTKSILLAGNGIAYFGTTTNAPQAFITNDVERGRWDTSGRFLVGTSSARSNFFNGSSDPRVQVEGTDTPTSALAVIRSSDNAGSARFILGKARGSTVGSNTVVSSGDVCGEISFQGSDGTEFVEAAYIRAEVDGTPGANDMPGRLVFSTTADGASSPTSRLKITSTGASRFDGTVVPEVDNTHLCGASGLRWSAIWAANGTIQTSDSRTKTDVVEAVLGADFVKSLRPVSYKWIEGGKRPTGEYDENTSPIYESFAGERTHWGFIAQEVKEAVDAAGVDFGGWVLADKDDPDSQQALRYDQFIAPLTKALQEALQKIETLEAKVAVLEAA